MSWQPESILAAKPVQLSSVLVYFVDLEEKRRKLFQDLYSRNQLGQAGSAALALWL